MILETIIINGAKLLIIDTMTSFAIGFVGRIIPRDSKIPKSSRWKIIAFCIRAAVAGAFGVSQGWSRIVFSSSTVAAGLLYGLSIGLYKLWGGGDKGPGPQGGPGPQSSPEEGPEEGPQSGPEEGPDESPEGAPQRLRQQQDSSGYEELVNRFSSRDLERLFRVHRRVSTVSAAQFRVHRRVSTVSAAQWRVGQQVRAAERRVGQQVRAAERRVGQQVRAAERQVGQQVRAAERRVEQQVRAAEQQPRSAQDTRAAEQRSHSAQDTRAAGSRSYARLTSRVDQEHLISNIQGTRVELIEVDSGEDTEQVLDWAVSSASMPVGKERADYECRITCAPFTIPVIASDGHTYDLGSLLTWVISSPSNSGEIKSPLSGIVLTEELTYNSAIATEMNEMIRAYNNQSHTPDRFGAI